MPLTPMQMRFLAERLTSESDAEAARRIGVADNTPANWKGLSPEFAERYQKVFEDGIELAQQIMRAHLGQAAFTLIENMKAAGEHGPDWAARNQAAKTLLQSHGLIRDSKDVHLSGGLTVEQLASEFEQWRKREPKTES